MFKKFGLLSRALVLLLSVSAAVFAGGCNSKINFIDHITFLPSDNLETVRVSLVFSNTIQTNLSGAFEIGEYGFLFVNPFTPAEPFEVGFSLNTNIVNDQHFLSITPTEVLPNGLPIGTPYALVQIQAESPISSKFDLYGYVDVLHASWLGAAAIFNFINDQYFPNGLAISQVFMRDANGNPGIIANVFGPTKDAGGGMSRAGGIALFANVRQLATTPGLGRNTRPLTFYPEKTMPMVTGPKAPEYQGQVKKLRGLESNLIRGFNTLK